MLGALCVWLPSTSLYKNAVNRLWSSGHYTLAYYLNRSDSALALREGAYYFGGGDYDLDRAAHCYQLALHLTPGVLWGHYQIARINFVEGHLDEALQEINAELVANPTNLRSLYVRGLIDDARHDLPAAEADFTQFVAWAPTEWAGYNDLSFVLAEEMQYTRAEQVVAQAFKKVPNAASNPWLWNSIGLAQLNELHYTQAATSFAEAKKVADQMTPRRWHYAYPGNDPASAAESIAAFRQAIDANLATAQKGPVF